MGKKIQKVSRSFVAIFLTITLVGCSGQTDANGKTGSGSSQSGSNGATGRETGGNRAGDAEPIVLTYGYIDAYSFEDLDSGVQERIVSFNRSQDDFFIEIVKYGEDSYADGLNALNADISAKKAPDIIAIDDEAFLCELGEKGVIEDLYPYIDNSEGPKRDDFVDNVLAGFEDGGKLYGMTPFFKIRSMVADPKVITSERVTFAQLKKMYEENKENDDIVVYNGLTRYALLGLCVGSSIESFVDMEKRTCDFQSESFRELLEFTAQFEPQVEEGWFGDDFENCVKLQEGKLYLYDMLIGSFRDYTHYREMTGEMGLLVGFPSLDVSTPDIGTNMPYFTINSKSEHKDAAWKFICTFLDDRYLADKDNISRSVGFPVTESGFTRVAQKAVNNKVSGEGSRSNVKGETITFPYYATTEEEVAYIREVIGKITPTEDYDEIAGIIHEEIKNYWNGTKSVEDVMETIQNRAQLYLDEM